MLGVDRQVSEKPQGRKPRGELASVLLGDGAMGNWDRGGVGTVEWWPFGLGEALGGRRLGGWFEGYFAGGKVCVAGFTAAWWLLE